MRLPLILIAVLAFSACTTANTTTTTTTTTTPVPPAATEPATATAAAPCRPGDALLHAALWMQSSAEYRANALQAYAAARQQLDAALADPSWNAVPGTSSTGLPPAVILDADETAIDNSAFEAQMIRKGMKYDAKEWTRWVNESAATAVPGVSEFLAYAVSRGVTPYFVTNRNAEEEAGTRRNFENLGFPLGKEDTILVRGERPEWSSGDKTARREFVASKHRVLLLIGDDLNDFVPARSLTVEKRDALVRESTANWGTKWIILPNAIYGSWEEAIGGRGEDCAQFQRKVDALRP